MDTIASQITSLTIVYSTVYSDADKRKYQSSASLAFVWGIHRRPVNSPHKWPVTRKMFPFDDVIMVPDVVQVTKTHVIVLWLLPNLATLILCNIIQIHETTNTLSISDTRKSLHCITDFSISGVISLCRLMIQSYGFSPCWTNARLWVTHDTGWRYDMGTSSNLPALWGGNPSGILFSDYHTHIMPMICILKHKNAFCTPVVFNDSSFYYGFWMNSRRSWRKRINVN